MQAPGPTARQIAARPAIRAWLIVIAAMVFAMVIVGGATRLTDSGLSITEWQPLLGAIPPLGEADWAQAFEKYRQIPEYQIINKGMSLAEFKVIYWWEWSHRFLGRAIGVVFFVPLVVFWLTGRLERGLAGRLSLLFVLGGLQGALGWYMVKSGLVERTDVSQYRLSAHLTLATVIFAATIWTALGIGQRRRPFALFRPHGWSASGLLVLILLQTALGGFVAGLDAGMAYNTWPLMDGRLVPDGLAILQPAWRNLFENALTVQFQHRVVAYLLLAAIVAHITGTIRGYAPARVAASAITVGLAAVLQLGLGIWTVLWQVPIWLGLLHQAGALLLLAAAVYHLHRVCVALRDGDLAAARAARPVSA